MRCPSGLILLGLVLAAGLPAEDKPVPTASAAAQAASMVQGGGSLDSLVSRLQTYAKSRQTPGEQRDVYLVLARLLVASGDFLPALEVLRPFLTDPAVGLYAARLALICNDDAALKTALLPLLADPARPEYAGARLVLGLQLFRAGNHAAVIEALGGNTDDASTMLLYLSLKRSGKDEEARTFVRERLEPAKADALLVRLGRLEKGYEFDPVSLILLGMGDLPGQLEADLALPAGAETDKPEKPSDAGKTDAQDSTAVIQVGFFSALDNARKLDTRLTGLSFRSRIIKEDKPNIRYKVVVDVPAGVDPQTILLSLKDKGIEGFLVR